jgi:hypothetical protein
MNNTIATPFFRALNARYEAPATTYALLERKAILDLWEQHQPVIDAVDNAASALLDYGATAAAITGWADLLPPDEAARARVIVDRLNALEAALAAGDWGTTT